MRYFFFSFLFLFRFTIFVVRLVEKQFAWFASVRNEDVPSNGQVATNHNLYVHSMVGLNRYASNNKRSRSTIIFWNFSRLSSYYIYVFRIPLRVHVIVPQDGNDSMQLKWFYDNRFDCIVFINVYGTNDPRSIDA